MGGLVPVKRGVSRFAACDKHESLNCETPFAIDYISIVA